MSSLGDQAQATRDVPQPALYPDLPSEDDPEGDEPEEAEDPAVRLEIRKRKFEQRQVRGQLVGSGDRGWTCYLTRKLGLYSAPIDHSWIIGTSTLSFRKVHVILQRIQWVLLAVLVLAGLVLPEIRDYLVKRSLTGSFLILFMEFASWAGLTLLLGSNNRFPVNYMSLVIMRIFICLQMQYEAVLKQAQEDAEILRQKSWWLPSSLFQVDYYRFWVHHWAQCWGIGWGVKEVEGSSKVEDMDVINMLRKIGSDSFTIPTNLVLGGTFFFATWFLTRFSHVRIDKLGNVMLSASFISTSVASLILVSSLTLDRFGSEFHLTLCKIWVPYALVTVWVLAFYLLQRLLCSGEEYWKKRRFAQVEFTWFAIETVMCIVQTSIVLHYIPAIHKDFEASSSLEISLWKFISFFLPRGMVLGFGGMESAVVFCRTVLENYYGFMPLAMGLGGGGGAVRPN